MKPIKRSVFKMRPAGALLGLACLCLAAAARSEDSAQANNPLANMVAFNVQQYFIGELTESHEDANQFWLRYARPFRAFEENWLLRASLPINSFPTGPNETQQALAI